MVMNIFLDGTPIGPLLHLPMPLGSTQTPFFPPIQAYSLVPGQDTTHTIDVGVAVDCESGTTVSDLSIDVTTIG
jgi:hypothetical protein